MSVLVKYCLKKNTKSYEFNFFFQIFVKNEIAFESNKKKENEERCF